MLSWKMKHFFMDIALHLEILIMNIGFFINGIIEEESIALWVLFLSVILFFMRLAKDFEPRRGIAYVLSNTLFLTLCVLEIMYVVSGGGIWFCEPARVG
jgi:hypothetical protein